MSDGDDIPSKSSCKYYNTWRYGFDNFTGTASGLLSPQQYFKQYITRDVISIVGYQDTSANGDTYCMANMQGGTKRRDRNLSWWQYVNTLAGTNEDLTGFPATFKNLPDWSNISGNAIQMQLIVVEDADHDAELVFNSNEGRASLFSTGKMPTGWRPDGWHPAPVRAVSSSSSSSNSSGSNRANANPTSAGTTSTTTNGVATLLAPWINSLLFSAILSLHYLM